MKSNRRVVFLIVLLAFSVRLLYLLVGPGLAAGLTEDEVQYDEIARNIVRDGSFYQDFGNEKRFYSFRAPLYPGFVAAVYAVGLDTPLAVRVLQCLLDALVAGVLYLIAAMLFKNSRVPLVAALLYCFYPFAIHRSVLLMAEALFALILSLAVLAFVRVETRVRREPSARFPLGMLVLCGFLLGLSALAKAGMLLMAPLAVAWAFFVFRKAGRSLRAAAVVCGVMVFVLLPWTLRNYAIHRRFVPVATEGGTTLLGGNNEKVITEPEFLGFWYNPSDLHTIPEGLDEVDESDAQTRAALTFIRGNLDEMPRLLFHKFVNTWIVHPYFITHGSASVRIARISYTLLVPLILAGAWLIRRRARRSPADPAAWHNPVIVWALFADILLVCLIFYGSARMRAPVEPYLLLFAAVPLSLILERVGGKKSAGVEKGSRKIAYIVSQFPETFETFVLREVVELQEREFDVEVFSLKKCRDAVVHPEAELIAAKTHYRPSILSPAAFGAVVRFGFGRPVRLLRALGCALSADVSMRDPLNGAIRTVKNLVVFPKACGIALRLESGGFHHVHAHWANVPTTVAMVISELTGLPMSFTAHAFDIYKGRPVLKKKIAKARFVVTCTDYNRRFLQRLVGSDPPKIILNYHGLDPDRFKPNGRMPSERLRLLAVGRLTNTKGFEYLLEACSILSREGVDFECVIAGEGEMRGGLEKAVERLGLEQRVRLLGVMDQESLRRLYGTSDIFVMPSVVAGDGDRDGIPNVVIEAMAMGLPIVASNISGLPEAVRHGQSGFLVPERDPAAIAEALAALARQPDLRRTMGDASRSRVMQRFVLKDNVFELVNVFENEFAA